MPLLFFFFYSFCFSVGLAGLELCGRSLDGIACDLCSFFCIVHLDIHSLPILMQVVGTIMK